MTTPSICEGCGYEMGPDCRGPQQRLCPKCWEREQRLTNEAIERAGQRLRDLT
jgi:hypothetical protein